VKAILIKIRLLRWSVLYRAAYSVYLARVKKGTNLLKETFCKTSFFNFPPIFPA